MLDLVPRDHWEHNAGDLCLGLASALRRKQDLLTLTLPEIGNCIPVGSGRTGLVAAIRSLNLPSEAKIAVPLYCCHVVFQAIVAAGCKPCFVDIDPETYCLSPIDLSKKVRDCSAVIAVHMFGNTCDMEEIATVAQKRPVIEDCAQALGSKIGGQPVGTFGDISFFSFRSGKYVSAGEGGAVYSREYLPKIREIVHKAPQHSPLNEVSHVLKVYIKSVLRSKPFYGIIGYKLWLFASKKTSLSGDNTRSITKIHISDRNIAIKRFAKLPSWIERQRANSELYTRLLKLGSNTLCREKPKNYYNRYHYPVSFQSGKKRDDMARLLLSKAIDSMKYLDGIVDVAKKHFDYSGDCQIAEELSQKVLVIPNYFSLQKTDIARIAGYINEGWNNTLK